MIGGILTGIFATLFVEMAVIIVVSYKKFKGDNK